MEIKQAFGHALRQIRNSKGLTQEDFSIISSRTYLSSLERGLKSPTIEKIAELASVLNIHPLTLVILTFHEIDPTQSIESLIDMAEKEIENIESLKIKN